MGGDKSNLPPHTRNPRRVSLIISQGRQASGKTVNNAEKFRGEIERYIAELLAMPPKVSASKHVLEFVKMNQEDFKFVDLERTLGANTSNAPKAPSSPGLRRCKCAVLLREEGW